MRTPRAATLLALFLLPLAAAAALAGQTKPAKSSGAKSVPMLTTLQLVADAKVDMCVGEQRQLLVLLQFRQARRPPRGQRPRWQTTVVPNAQIRGDVINNVGTLSPAMSRTGIIGRAGPFNFQARQLGRTSVEFTLNASAITNPTTGQRILRPKAVTRVVVSSCKWQIIGHSRWQMPAGFQPTMESTFEKTVDINQISQGVPLDITTIVTNTATGKAMYGCTPKFTVPATTVDMRLNRARNSDILISVFYDPVHPTTKLVCRAGLGMRLGDIGTPFGAPLLNLRFARSGVAQSSGSKTLNIRHLLKTGTRGNAPGWTDITVISFIP